jgi:hypothetical protein
MDQIPSTSRASSSSPRAGQGHGSSASNNVGRMSGPSIAPGDAGSTAVLSPYEAPRASSHSISRGPSRPLPGWLRRILNDQPPAADLILRSLPHEILRVIGTELESNNYDVLALARTSRHFGSVALDTPADQLPLLRFSVLLTIIAARTPTGRDAYQLFQQAHQYLPRAMRTRVLESLQERLADAHSPNRLPYDEALDCIEWVLEDNARLPVEDRFDFSRLEMRYAYVLQDEVRVLRRPIDTILNGLRFPLGSPARQTLESTLLSDHVAMDELLDDATPRADDFIQRWGIGTPEVMEEVEMKVCCFTMPAGEMAMKRERPANEIADDYGIRRDQPNAPNRAREMLRSLYERQTPIYL